MWSAAGQVHGSRAWVRCVQSGAASRGHKGRWEERCGPGVSSFPIPAPNLESQCANASERPPPARSKSPAGDLLRSEARTAAGNVRVAMESALVEEVGAAGRGAGEQGDRNFWAARTDSHILRAFATPKYFARSLLPP